MGNAGGKKRRVALVTGGASGIGWATARELANQGWSVAIGDVRAEEAIRRVEGEAGDLMGFGLDVTDPASVEAGFAHVLDWHGQLDLLVNNAGIQRIGRVEELPWEDWSAVLSVNLDGAFRCMQAAGRHMLKAGHGAIVNLSSISAVRGAIGRVAYIASKAGIEAITRTAAVEWASRGVRVNAVGPGYVDTELIAHHVAEGEISLDPIIQRTPAGRLARPEEIARAICFLGSDEVPYLTGQVLYVDGAFLADYGVGSIRRSGGRPPPP